MIAAKHNLAVHNPTNKQLALALQLEPSMNVWRFLRCKLSADTFFMIIQILVTTYNSWNELDFIECHPNITEFEMVSDCFCTLKNLSVARKLNFSLSTLTSSSASVLKRIITIWKVEQLIISDEQLYYSIVDRLEKQLCSSYKEVDKHFQSVSCGNMNTCCYCNMEWRLITAPKTSMVTSLFIANCQLSDLNEYEFVSKLKNLSKLVIINSSLNEKSVCNLGQTNGVNSN